MNGIFLDSLSKLKLTLRKDGTISVRNASGSTVARLWRDLSSVNAIQKH